MQEELKGREDGAFVGEAGSKVEAILGVFSKREFGRKRRAALILMNHE